MAAKSVGNSQEIWKPVPGYEGLYEASNNGRIRSLDRSVECSDGSTRTYRGRVLRLGVRSDDRKTVVFSKNGLTKTCNIARTIAATFLGPCPEDREVNHIDGDRTNDGADNLEYVTALENTRHAMALGIFNTSGSAHGNAKLTESDIREMRRRSANGEAPIDMKDDYPVNMSTIRAIIRGDVWTHA